MTEKKAASPGKQQRVVNSVCALEYYLKKQVEKFGPSIKLTHQEIATDLNSSREVISRLMKKMEKNGWIVLHRNSFEWIKK